MSNTAVVPFYFQDQEVRTVILDGEHYWVAKDVADILGYQNTNDAIAKHCKGVAKRYPLQTAGGVQDVRIIHEPDLYRLIVGSKLPAAQKFERWVFEEVLPTLRKTGSYGMSQTTQELGEHCRQVNKALATPGLDYQTRWAIASRLCKAIFGEDAAYMLGEREVRALRSELDGRARTEKFGIASVLVLTDQGIQLAPALRMMFVEECCTIKPGLAAPESALYAVFERWWRWSFGFDAPPLDLFRVMITGRIRRFALGGEPWYLGIEPQEACPWLLSKKPGRLPGPDSLDGEVRP